MIWGTKLGTAREGFQRANDVLAEVVGPHILAHSL